MTEDIDEPQTKTKGSVLSKKIAKTPKNSSPSDDASGAKKPRAKRALWQPHEDAKLLKLVEKYGQKWTEIGRKIGGRTCKQVRDRYLNNLRPNINNSPFTKEEDEKLVELYLKLGTKWKQIAELIPGRTESQVKNRFYIYHKDSVSQYNKNALQIAKIGSNSSVSTAHTFIDTNKDMSETVEESPVDLDERFCLATVVKSQRHGSYNTFQREFFKTEEQVLTDYQLPEGTVAPQSLVKDFIDLDEHFKAVQNMLFGAEEKQMELF